MRWICVLALAVACDGGLAEAQKKYEERRADGWTAGSAARVTVAIEDYRRADEDVRNAVIHKRWTSNATHSAFGQVVAFARRTDAETQMLGVIRTCVEYVVDARDGIFETLESAKVVDARKLMRPERSIDDVVDACMAWTWNVSREGSARPTVKDFLKMPHAAQVDAVRARWNEQAFNESAVRVVFGARLANEESTALGLVTECVRGVLANDRSLKDLQPQNGALLREMGRPIDGAVDFCMTALAAAAQEQAGG